MPKRGWVAPRCLPQVAEVSPPLTLQVGGDGFTGRAQRRSARRPRTRCPGDICIQPGHMLYGYRGYIWLYMATSQVGAVAADVVPINATASLVEVLLRENSAVVVIFS